MLGFGLGLLVGIPVGVVLGVSWLGYGLYRLAQNYGAKEPARCVWCNGDDHTESQCLNGPAHRANPHPEYLKRH